MYVYEWRGREGVVTDDSKRNGNDTRKEVSVNGMGVNSKHEKEWGGEDEGLGVTKRGSYRCGH